MPENNQQYLARTFQEQKGRLTSILTYYLGTEHLTVIEDLIQDTFYAALKTWPTNPPRSPEAWLITVAKNKAINYIKKSKNLSFSEQLDHLVFWNAEDVFSEKEIENSQLNLLFACSCLDLSEKNKIILILKLLGGFEASQIARVLVQGREAVFKSLQRSLKNLNKEKLKYYLDNPSSKNLETVNTVLYLMFHEGFQTYPENASRGKDLCHQAIYLTNLLIDRGIGQTDTLALLSLMYFNLARFDSRKSDLGSLILLENQDRQSWDKKLITLGFKYLQNSGSGFKLSPFHLEAAIASVHCSSDSFANTDWKKILWLYDRLIEIKTSPIILLNKAIVVYYLEGPEKAWGILEDIGQDPKISSYHLFYAVKGEIALHSGNQEIALSLFKQALSLTKSELEKELILGKIKEMKDSE